MWGIKLKVPIIPSLMLLAFYILLFGLACPSAAISAVQIELIPYTLNNGEVIYLPDNREPSAYTKDYVDCLGQSQVDLTRFDVAYYKDNMTVLFHLQGSTPLNNQSLMVSLEIYAYGSNYWTMIFDACQINAQGLCPTYNNVSIQANGVIPISESEANLIPDIALAIPDFEGQAVLRLFSNSTQTEVACYAAVITNGNSFSHPVEVGSILGTFTILAVIASAIVVIKCDSLGVTRKHYAHTMSIFVVFEVFHSIYFTGALSMDWPSVLPAFWSNYAWAAGMIYTNGMQQTISEFVGLDTSGVTKIGAIAAGQPEDSVGGVYNISSIFGRNLAHYSTQALHSRGLPDISTGYLWYGFLAASGLPVPGNYNGFAGTLAADGGLTMSNAFMTGLLWFLIALAAVLGFMLALKWVTEGLAYLYLIQRDVLPYFRKHWLEYLTGAVFRTVFIAYFMITFLCLFQLTYGGRSGVIAIAAIFFILVTFGLFAIATYACFVQLRSGKHNMDSDTQHLEASTQEGYSSVYGIDALDRKQEDGEEEAVSPKWKIPLWTIRIPDQGRSVHDDVAFTRTFGWFTARYKGSRWWFFLVWLLYQFLRACFLAGAIFRPLTQVLGLLVVEILALAGIIYLRPYESHRLNALVVYFLGFSKVATTALATTFYAPFNLPRITTTAIGVVIIVIQGILTILLLVAICAGIFTSYISLTRTREVSSTRLNDIRVRYFSHIDRVAAEKPKKGSWKGKQPEMKEKQIEQAFEEEVETPMSLLEPEPAATSKPYFKLGSIRRINKIEDDTPGDNSSDEGDDDIQQLDVAFDKAGQPERRGTPSSVNSISSRRSRNSLPYGARVGTPRRSWSLHEGPDFGEESSRIRRAHTVSAGSSYSAIEDVSLGHLRSYNTSPVPPMPDLATSPYMDHMARAARGASIEVRSLSPTNFAISQGRPRSTTVDGIPLRQGITTPHRLVSGPYIRATIHEAAPPSQDAREMAMLAAQKALQRNPSVRSYTSTKSQRTTSVRSQASDIRGAY